MRGQPEASDRVEAKSGLALAALAALTESRGTLDRQSCGSGPPAVYVGGLFDARDEANWARPQRERDIRQFVILERGFAVAESEGGRWAMAAGSILALPPGAPHALRFSRGAKGRVIRAWEATLLARVAPVLPAASPRLWRILASSRVLRYWEGRAKQALREELFREIDAVCKHLGPGYEPVVVGYLFVILFRWMEPLITQGSEQVADVVLLERFCSLVERAFCGHHTVSAYSDALGVSKSRLTRACAELSGRSPLEIVHDRLMLEAQRELTYSDASIAEVAQRLGFGDPNYFVRFFAKRMGATPAQFRARGARSAKAIHAPRARSNGRRGPNGAAAHSFSGAT